MMTSSTTGIAAVLVGAIGLMIHGSLAAVPTPVLYNHLSSLWGASMLIIAGVELFLLGGTLSGDGLSRQSLLIAYHAAIGVLALVYGICYAVDTRFDNAAWGLLHAIVCAITVVAVHRTKHVEQSGGLSAGVAALEKGIPKSKDSSATRSNCVNSCAFVTIRTVRMTVMLLLTAGAAVGAFAATAFPRTGELITVLVQDEPVTLNVRCVGPPASAPKPNIASTHIPSIWLTQSAAHGATGDHVGMQHFLAEEGFRSCAFDPPGFGYSARQRLISIDMASYLPQLIEAIEPPGAEIVIVAFGGGGSAAAALGAGFADKIKSKHTFRLSGIVFANVFPSGIEWDDLARKRKLNDVQRAEARASDLRSRLSLTQLILGLASPWGLLPLFAPVTPAPLEYFPADRYAELRVAAWRPQLWVNQYWGLRRIAASNDSDDPLVSAAPLPKSMPLGHLLCSADGDLPCKQSWRELTGDECTQAKERARFYLSRQKEMTEALQPDSSKRAFTYDGERFCSIGFGVDFPQRTARNVASLIVKMLDA